MANRIKNRIYSPDIRLHFHIKIFQSDITFYSLLKLFTGFAIAALPALIHKIASAAVIIIIPLNKNIHQLKLVW